MAAMSDGDLAPRDRLCRSFSLSGCSLNMVHINAQSIPGHYDDIVEVFRGSNVDVIGVSESWLKPHIPSTSVELTGYRLYRNDRVGRGGGGVAVYVHDNLVSRVVLQSDSQYSRKPEYLFIEITSKQAKLLFITIYRPPKIELLSNIENDLMPMLAVYDNIVICGDFNCDMNGTSRVHDREFLTGLFRTCSLEALPLQPTHHTATSHTLIDWLLVSDLNMVLQHGQFPAPSISNHDLLYLSYNLKINKPPLKFLTFRDFSRFNSGPFYSDAMSANWESVLRSFDINEKITLLNANILNLFNKHAPLRKVRVTHPPAPWLTMEIRATMKERDVARRKYGKTKLACDFEAFRRLRNKSKQMVRNAKLRYSHDLFQSCSGPGDVWRTLRKFKLHCKDGDQQHPLVVPEDELNKYFTSASGGGSAGRDRIVEEYNTRPRPSHNPFHFSHVYPEDIVKATRKITSQAKGEDKIPISFIKKLLQVITPVQHF